MIEFFQSLEWWQITVLVAGVVIALILIGWGIRLAVKPKAEDEVVVEPKPREVRPVAEVKKPEAKEEAVVTKPAERTEPEEEEVSKEELLDESKQPANTYHVSQNKDKKSPHHLRWRIRKARSQKTIKYFDTQNEAIEVAKGLAERNDGSVVIHKVDGSIRRQNYKK